MASSARGWSRWSKRCEGNVILVEEEWGKVIAPEKVEEALKSANGPVKAVAIVHGETSTGILQPIDEISRIAHQHGALLVVDAVTSLSGCELLIDEWGVDVCYSGTQKCLSGAARDVSDYGERGRARSDQQPVDARAQLVRRPHDARPLLGRLAARRALTTTLHR